MELVATSAQLPTVLDAIKSLEGKPVKESDIAIKTGLTTNQVADAFEAMMREYMCNIKVDETGELIYLFDFTDKLGEEKKPSFLSRLKSFGKSALKWSFKGWIVFMGLFYLWGYLPFVIYALPSVLMASLVAFVPVIIGLFFYAIIATYSKTGQQADRGLVAKLSKFQKDLFSFFLGDKPFFYGLHKFRKNFIKTVFDFALGEKPEPQDKRWRNKNILAYLSANGYKITSAEISALTGLSLAKSENEAARLLGEYHGDVKVTQNGVILYEFPELRNQIHQENQRSFSFIWDNPSPKLEWNSNFTFENGFIIGAGLFLLIASGTLLFTGEQIPFDLLPEFFQMHWLPFAFTTTFFATAFVGKYRLILKNRLIEKRNQFHAHWKKAFKSANKLTVNVNSDTSLSLANQLEGNFKVDKRGSRFMRFPRILEELSDMAEERNYHAMLVIPEKELILNEEEVIEINSHIRYQKKGDELIINIRKRGKNEAPFNLMAFMVIQYLLTIPLGVTIDWLLDPTRTAISVLPFVFMLGAFLVSTAKTLNELSFLVNGFQFHFKPKGCEVTSGPIPFIGYKGKIKYDEFNGLMCRKHTGPLHKLMLNIASEKFAKNILLYETDRNSLIQVEELVSDYLHKYAQYQE